MRLLRWLRRTFLGGVLVVLPLALTSYVLWLLYRVSDSLFGYATPIGELIRTTLGVWIPGMGFYVTLVLVLLLGIFMRNYVGRTLYHHFEQRIICSIPIVRKMYSTIKQIIDAVFARDTSAFKRVVLVEYPRRGAYTIGFVTNAAGGVLGEHLPEACLSVFIFTVPNPMSGYYVIVPEKDVIDLNVPVEEGIRMTVSMGMVLDNRGTTGARPPRKELNPDDVAVQQNVL